MTEDIDRKYGNFCTLFHGLQWKQSEWAYCEGKKNEKIVSFLKQNMFKKKNSKELQDDAVTGGCLQSLKVSPLAHCQQTRQHAWAGSAYSC